ncbi:uncharacterized protein TNCV_3091041 [Trichonephila clavipes]|uniref:Uncharacterized protein n=1 Tax=Trichonephila clavipes TaxID=2585209 RepID=A0A8X7BH59_TRICX|nr:uncharacterized protein TNCV_3091041 [Trichonephila clavipes]
MFYAFEARGTLKGRRAASPLVRQVPLATAQRQLFTNGSALTIILDGYESGKSQEFAFKFTVSLKDKDRVDASVGSRILAGGRLDLYFFRSGSVTNISRLSSQNNLPAVKVAVVAEWYRHRIVAGFVTSSSPVPLKTRRVGQRCTLNLSRAEMSSRWCGVVVMRGGASSGVVHVT